MTIKCLIRVQMYDSPVLEDIHFLSKRTKSIRKLWISKKICHLERREEL
jgi:hypothetical protein